MPPGTAPAVNEDLARVLTTPQRKASLLTKFNEEQENQ